MIRIPKQGLAYALFTFAVIGVFLYAHFPEETVRRYLQYGMERLFPGQRLMIERLRLSFPPGIHMESATVAHGDLTVAEIKPVTLSPKLLSLLGDRPAMRFRGTVYGGTVSGTVMLDKRETPPIISVDARFSDIQIQRMAFLRIMSENTASGLLNGVAEYSGNAMQGGGSATFALKDVTLELATPLFNLNALSFSSVDAKTELQNRETLRIVTGSFKGEQVGGTFSGAITLKNPVRQSLLDINGTLRPHPSFIAKLGQMVAALFKNKRTGGDFPFRLTGTVEQPDFALN